MSAPIKIRYSIFAAVLFLLPTLATAQQSRDDSSARLRLQMNQANAEIQRLQQENGTLKADLDEAQKELERVQDSLDRTESRLSRANSTADRYRQATERNSDALQQARERTEEIVAQFRETIGALRAVEQSNSELQAELASVQSDYQSCARDNAELYEVGQSVVTAFEDTGVFTRIVQKEPFTQLARVRLENLVDDYRFALQDHRMDVETPEQSEL